MLLTITQILSLRKVVQVGSSADIKLSKAQLHEIGQSGQVLSRLLGPLLKTNLP